MASHTPYPAAAPECAHPFWRVLVPRIPPHYTHTTCTCHLELPGYRMLSTQLPGRGLGHRCCRSHGRTAPGAQGWATSSTWTGVFSLIRMMSPLVPASSSCGQSHSPGRVPEIRIPTMLLLFGLPRACARGREGKTCMDNGCLSLPGPFLPRALGFRNEHAGETIPSWDVFWLEGRRAPWRIWITPISCTAGGRIEHLVWKRGWPAGVCGAGCSDLRSLSMKRPQEGGLILTVAITGARVPSVPWARLGMRLRMVFTAALCNG